MRNQVRFFRACLGMSLLLFCSYSTSLAQDSLFRDHLNEAKNLIQKGKDSAALLIYQDILQKDTAQKEALSYTSILLSRKGERQEDSKEAKALFQRAQSLALHALQTAPNYTPAPYAYALSLYLFALRQGMKEKFKDFKEVKDYLDRSLMLDSTFALSWYLLGRWNMSFHKLNLFEKAAAKLFFGGLPQADAENAVACHQKCKAISPSFIRNYYYLAKALHAEGKDLQALSTLKEAISLRPILKGDRHIQEKCKEMVEQLH